MSKTIFIYELFLTFADVVDKFLLNLEYFDQELPTPLSSFVDNIGKLFQRYKSARFMNGLSAIFAFFVSASEGTFALRMGAQLGDGISGRTFDLRRIFSESVDHGFEFLISQKYFFLHFKSCNIILYLQLQSL